MLEHFKTDEELERWSNIEGYEQQRAEFEFAEGHSGNTFASAVGLARRVAQGLDIEGGLGYNV